MLFDLHCDTASKIYKNKENLFSNTRVNIFSELQIIIPQCGR